MNKRSNAKKASKNYHVVVFLSQEDGGYIADIPGLDSCSAFGKTREEALREIELAKAARLEAAKAEGKPIPKPRYRTPIYQVEGADLHSPLFRLRSAAIDMRYGPRYHGCTLLIPASLCVPKSR